MAQAASIRAGAAFIELSVKDSKLVKGLQAALTRLKSFGSALQNIGSGIRTAGLKLAALGAGLVTPLIASAKSFAEMGDQLDKMSQRTGISVEALSELAHAATLSGASLEDVETGIRHMQRTIGQAVGGSKAAAEALAALGLTAEQLQILSPDQQFEVIGKRLNEIQDPAERAAAAMEVFGRSGTNLLPMMADLAALRAEARRLGLVMSTEDAKAAATLNDAMDRMWAALRRVVVTVGSALAPILSEWAEKIVRLASAARTWISENQGLIVSILKIGAALIGAGIALTFLGSIISAVGTIFGLFATVASTALSFLLSPIGLVIAAIVGLGATIAWATGAGGQALQWLGSRFDDLKNFALASFQGIKDALAAGDVALAARILWLSLQVVWRAGINTLKGWWLDFKGWFLKLTGDIFWGAVALVAEAWFSLRKIWATTVNFWADVLRSFANFFVKTWNEITGWLAKQITKVMGFFDETIDVEATNRLIDEETRRDNAALDKQALDARIKGEQEIDEIERERQGTLAAIADMADEEERARRAESERERKEGEDALAAAKEEWRLAIEQARVKREAAESAKQPETPPAPELPPPPDLGQVKQDVQAAIPEIEQQVKVTLDVVGTFSAEAADRIGLGSSVQERTAKASEETAKNTKKIAQKIEAGAGLVFE
jgi:hypothetical protein